MIRLTNRQARQFLLVKHGLLGARRFTGKAGALAYIRQCGCIQFDPVDVCGKNAELVLQARVGPAAKKILYDLLYKDRALVDYTDKNQAIFPVEDWPYFAHYRTAAKENGLRFEELHALEAPALDYIRTNGPVCSDDLPLSGEVAWHSVIHWSGSWHGTTKAARSVLEQLYSAGELVIHHKAGARKYYDLAERHIPAELLAAPSPFADDFDRLKWRVLRRIGAVGLLWDRPSDAWLHIQDLTNDARHEAFRQLEAEGRIAAVQVEGIRPTLYLRSEDLPLLEEVLHTEKFTLRCEALAPLDCLLWDRKLIRALFGFHYMWEIYTPAEKRQYGYYVLPLVYGDAFVGRLEAAADAKTGVLTLKNVWYEDGVRQSKALHAAVERCVQRLAKFNGCGTVENLIGF